MGFVVDETVGVAVEHGVYAQGENVLVVGGEDAGVHDCSPGNFNAFINGLCAEDACGADFVGPFSGLVEHEGKDVFVVGDGDADGDVSRWPTLWCGSGELTCSATQALANERQQPGPCGSSCASSQYPRLARAGRLRWAFLMALPCRR